MPMTKADVESIVEKVERRLSVARSEGVPLRVAGHQLDDDWLYVIVVPDQAGIRASDHADLMSTVERELRAAGDDHVLLVPTIED